MRSILLVEEREHDSSRQRVDRSRVQILVAAVPLLKGRSDGHRLTGRRALPHFEQELARAGQLAIGQRSFRRRERTPVEGEDAKIKRFVRCGSDGDRDGQRPASLQMRISPIFPSTMSFGSVISCTCSTVTPGASSRSRSPWSVTSRTQ